MKPWDNNWDIYHFFPRSAICRIPPSTRRNVMSQCVPYQNPIQVKSGHLSDSSTRRKKSSGFSDNFNIILIPNIPKGSEVMCRLRPASTLMRQQMARAKIAHGDRTTFTKRATNPPNQAISPNTLLDKTAPWRSLIIIISS